MQGMTMPNLSNQGDSVIKVKSLPYDACQLDVLQFFDGFRIRPNGVQLVIQGNNKPSGEVCNRRFSELLMLVNILLWSWFALMALSQSATGAQPQVVHGLQIREFQKLLHDTNGTCRHLWTLTAALKQSVPSPPKTDKCLHQNLVTAMYAWCR